VQHLHAPLRHPGDGSQCVGEDHLLLGERGPHGFGVGVDRAEAERHHGPGLQRGAESLLVGARERLEAAHVLELSLERAGAEARGGHLGDERRQPGVLDRAYRRAVDSRSLGHRAAGDAVAPEHRALRGGPLRRRGGGLARRRDELLGELVGEPLDRARHGELAGAGADLGGGGGEPVVSHRRRAPRAA
jgi:hypothetical protein